MPISRILALAAALAAAALPLAALEFAPRASLTASTETNESVWAEAGLSVTHEAAGFEFSCDGSVDTSGTYGGFFGGGFGTGNLSILVNEGGLRWKGDRLSLEAGKLALRDVVDSPYSLFLSGRGNEALTAEVRYEDGGFFFRDRWIALNYDSENADASKGSWPDRSAVLKTYGVKVGEFRAGFQDLVVYTGESRMADDRGPLFDAEYFLNPMPGVLLQFTGTSMDAPWEKNSRIDDNSITGFFVAWEREGLSADAQILIDDFNMNRFLSPGSYQNPDKLAWTAGASMDTPYGRFRLDHAGATAYTFSASSGHEADNPVLDYGYTFYPAASFDIDGSAQTISPESNYVGYLHGENNLAFMASWFDRLGAIDAAASLELVLSGSKCPQDPWHELSSFPDGTRFLDDSVLEKRLLLSGKAMWRLGGGFEFFATGSVGYVWNKLALKNLAVVADDGSVSATETVAVYVPSEESAAIGSLKLGGLWRLKL